MRVSVHVLFCCVALVAPLKSAAAARSIMDMEVPGAVALSESPPGHWIFKSFPAFLPLYVFEGDRPGKSMCDEVCTAVWPILKADEHDTPKGLWTILNRDDGRRQWAYKGHPVYTFYQDTPNNAEGVGRTANWYYEESAADNAVSKVSVRSGSGPAWRLLQP